MTVKNEAGTLEDCLDPIIDLFQQVVVIDTGSTDGTQGLLRDRFGIAPIQMALDESSCYSLAPVRNAGFNKLDTPWILSLDADERIDRKELLSLTGQDDSELPVGFFCAWITYFGEEKIIEDYKLSLFRSGFQKNGLVHDTVQASLRYTGSIAEWTDLFRIHHRPGVTSVGEKDEYYEKRLDCACCSDPDWLRYHWFKGYMHFRRGEHQKAESLLRKLHIQRPQQFPVESLNASMVLADLYAQNNNRQNAKSVVQEALQYYHHVADDFEVKVNFRLVAWFESALEYLNSNNLHNVKAYSFPY